MLGKEKIRYINIYGIQEKASLEQKVEFLPPWTNILKMHIMQEH